MFKISLAVFLLLFSQYITNISASFNLYLNQNEVKRLFGIPAELFYVRDGITNNHAIDSVIPVPTQLGYLSFSWQSLGGRNIPYEIFLDVPKSPGLTVPQLNISDTGFLPLILETFTISIQCTGLETAESLITIKFNFVSNRSTNNITSLTIKRNKICTKTEIPSTVQNDSNFVQTAINIFHIAFGCIVCLIIFITMLASSVHIENKPVECSVNPQPTFLSTMLPISQNLFTGESPFSDKTDNYYSFRKLSRPLSDEQSKNLKEKIKTVSVQRCRICLKNVILEGTFSRVYDGTYTTEDSTDRSVFVKTVTTHASETQTSLLLQEGMTMYALEHPNILSILGVSIEENLAPLLVYPCDDDSNLKKFLQKCKLCPEGIEHTLTTQEVVHMALQVVHGMQYLHSKMLKHRDLAARNCVVDDKLRIRITDNALSRDLFPADYHCLGDNENRPIKWLSVESLQHNLFFFQSDVWSFGVLLWEFMTLAQQPYAEIDPFEMEVYLRDGYRLAQPVNCPDELFAVMAYCWAMKMEERPSFKQLQVCLQEFYTQLMKYV